ncbi:MAG: hypothetical protein WAU43_08780, partial [Acidobacteriaceae bacterium]
IQDRERADGGPECGRLSELPLQKRLQTGEVRSPTQKHRGNAGRDIGIVGVGSSLTRKAF